MVRIREKRGSFFRTCGHVGLRGAAGFSGDQKTDGCWKLSVTGPRCLTPSDWYCPFTEKNKQKKNTTKDKEHCEQCSPLQCPSFIPSVMDTFPLCFFLGYMGGDFLLLNSGSPAPRTARCTSTRGRHWQKPAVRYFVANWIPRVQSEAASNEDRSRPPNFM